MIPITNIDSIGDSLSAISLNYDMADSRTYYLNLSSKKLFEPLKLFIDEKCSSFLSIISLAKTNSSKWIDLKTSITTNSASWIKPIVYTHPIILQDPVNVTTFYQVTAAFSQKYPIFINEYPEYVENQKAYVYYYVYDSINRSNFAQSIYSNPAYCQCPPSYDLIVKCVDTSSGKVNCDNGTKSCASCAKTCFVKKQIWCYYENGVNAINRYIVAKVNAKFTDRYEKSLKCAIFQVKNCKWEFLKYL